MPPSQGRNQQIPEPALVAVQCGQPHGCTLTVLDPLSGPERILAAFSDRGASVFLTDLTFRAVCLTLPLPALHAPFYTDPSSLYFVSSV